MLATNNYIHFKIKDPASGAILHEWDGAEKANHALPEDQVKILDDGSLTIVQRAPKKTLVGIWEVTSKFIYGLNSRKNPYYLCRPLNKGFPPFLVARNMKLPDQSRDYYITFRFEDWNETTYPRGSFESLLGPVEEFDVEARALQILSCPWAAKSKLSFQEDQGPEPTLQLSENTFNIDPPGCKDIDDCLTILPHKNQWKIYITIADVARSIQPETSEFELAQKIAATTYQNGEATGPMLSRQYSEDKCSLLPGKERYGVALESTWCPEQKRIVSTPIFHEVRIQNQKSFTYESIVKYNQPLLEILKEFTSFLAGRPTHDSHEWVEQCMLFYNKEVAKVLHGIGCGILRAHDTPFEEKRKILHTIDPRLEKLAFQSAKYVPVGTDSSHYGLGTNLYCHASSPIRRFSDLVNQTILKESIHGKTIQNFISYTQTICEYLNQRQKEIASAERDFQFLKAVAQAPSAQVRGQYLWKEKEKFVFWIDSWQTTIRFEFNCAEPQPGDFRTIQYYCDRRKPTWKEKMIFSI